MPFFSGTTFFIALLLLTLISSVDANGDQNQRTSRKIDLPLLQMVEPLLAKKEQASYEKVMSYLPEDPSQAISFLENMGKDRSAIMNFLLGNIYLSQQKTEAGITALKSSLQQFPNFLQAHRSLAGAYANLEQLDKALQHCSQAIALGGSDANLYGLLGYAHYQQGRHASSLSAYRMATMLEPENEQFQQGELFSLASAGRHTEVLSKIDELLPRDTQQTQFWVLKANAHLSLKENEKAMVTFETLRQMGKADGPTLSRLARLYFNEGLHHESVKVLEEALSNKGSPSDALTVLEALISIDSNLLAFRLTKSLGTISWKTHDLDQRHALALAQVDLLQKNREGAEKKLRNLLQRFPTHGSALLSLARLLLETDRPDEARLHYERASAFEEVQLRAWHALARLSWQEGNTPDALNWLEKIQNQSPTRELMETIQRLKRDLPTN